MLKGDQFNILIESLDTLVPAIVTFKRGTVIRCDHIRLVKPKRLLIMGINHGIYERHGRDYPKGPSAQGQEFIGGYKWVPGWAGSPPYEGYPGKYNAEKILIVNYKFEKILTANLENIESIKKL